MDEPSSRQLTRRPKLAATLGHWRRRWEVAAQLALVRGQQGKLASVRERLEQELQQVKQQVATALAEKEQLRQSFAQKLRDAQVSWWGSDMKLN